MSERLKQPLLLGQQPDEGNVTNRASCLAERQATRSKLYSVLALHFSAVLLPASVVCIASLAYSIPAPKPSQSTAAPVSLQDVLFLQAAAVCCVLALGISSYSLWHSKWTRRQSITCLLLLCTFWTVATGSILAGSNSSSNSSRSAGPAHWLLPEIAVKGALGLAVILPAAPLFILAVYAVFSLHSQCDFTSQLGERVMLLCGLGFNGLLLLAVPGNFPLQFALLGAFVLCGRVYSGYAMEYVEAVVLCRSSSSSSSSSSGTAALKELQEGPREESCVAEDSLGAALLFALSGGCVVLISAAAFTTAAVAADASTLLLTRFSSITTCSPIWISSAAAQAELSSPSNAGWVVLLLAAVSVVLHVTYAAAYRMQSAVFEAWAVPGAAADAAHSHVMSSRVHPLLLIGLQLSCLVIGALVGLASCAV